MKERKQKMGNKMVLIHWGISVGTCMNSDTHEHNISQKAARKCIKATDSDGGGNLVHIGTRKEKGGILLSCKSLFFFPFSSVCLFCDTHTSPAEKTQVKEKDTQSRGICYGYMTWVVGAFGLLFH